MHPEEVSLFERVVLVTRRHLGPAAERFVTQQIYNHLQIDPTTLATTDLQQLIDWIRVAVSFITDDSDLVNDYINELKMLAKISSTTKK